jgi:hypothetical protein
MPASRRPRGAALIVTSLMLLVVAGALAAIVAGLDAPRLRERATERALAEAREALIAYAADRPLSAVVGPGYLPCPDLDGDGWAESTCGSLDGSSGQDQRLGRLPWKTLGLPQLRDGDGEPLWYAVSSKHKGLLNCAASRGCVDMSPAAALGTITLRDPAGRVVHDGTIADPRRARDGGVAAVVIAPGAPLARVAPDGTRSQQRRDCAPGQCDAAGTCLTDPPRLAAPCDPANYLDRAPSEDNADFVDRNDAPGRPQNGNGFIEGPVRLPGGALAVNDRIAVVAYRDLMPAVMRRVALELVHCLRYYATRPENGGRYPWPARSCGEGVTFGSASDVQRRVLGTVADTPFMRSVDASAGRLVDRWWRHSARSPEALGELPSAQDACLIAVSPDDPGPARHSMAGSPADEGETAGFAGNAWWSTWQPYVAYALAPGFAPDAPSTDCASGCLSVETSAGRLLASSVQVAVVVSTGCETGPTCVDTACARILLADDADGTRHAIATYP